MAYVNVDIDMDEFETDELIDEISKRLRKSYGRKAVTDTQKKLLRQSVEELSKELLSTPTHSIEIKSLDDKIKYEHLEKVWSKYSSVDIEKLLP